MASQESSEAAGVFGAVIVPILLSMTSAIMMIMTAACSPTPQDAGPSAPETSEKPPAPTTVWSAMLQRTPYPYTTPLPPAEPTVLDGTYVKFDPRPGRRAPCRRCPPYPPEGGVWRLSLDKGIFRVVHDAIGWATLGSFTVSEDRIAFFNDPHCYEDVGIYAWRLESGKLTLEVVEDGCGAGLRARNLVSLPWESCQPPSMEAAITDHWSIPIGCDTPQTTPEE
jgi:hypothetical protein